MNPSGTLVIVQISTQAIVHTMNIGGQPDSIAVSPDHHHAVIAVENERDEDLGEGGLPQTPPGFVMIVHTTGAPATWTSSVVSLTGLPIDYNTDPEPEFVSINSQNQAVVTLQENNAVVIIDVPSGTVVRAFSMGTVDLHQVDLTEEDVVLQVEDQLGRPREPDGVVWIDDDYFVTADEGDWHGGSRGFTIWDVYGNVVYTSGNSNDHIVASIGHYPEQRSGNKGNEPENVDVGWYGNERVLFLNSERSSVTFVYNVDDVHSPKLLQVIPTGSGPEGGLAIPSRDLYVTACEVDSRGDVIRSVLSIFHRSLAQAQYPTIMSKDRADGTPIPFSALSGLAAGGGTVLYSIEDSFYAKSRIFTLNVATHPAYVVHETRIVDTNNVFASLAPEGDFSASDLAALINPDKTVNIDPEGIAYVDDRAGAYFIVASEGAGTVGDAGRPVTSLNFLFKVGLDGKIWEVITLPTALNNVQLRFGFEGVAVEGGVAYVAFQRAWNGEPNPRIGVYDLANGVWTFCYYPLDAPASQNGGWVGVSEITALGDKEFLVLERDNQGGPDAAIKKVYKIDLKTVTPVPYPSAPPTVSKTMVMDVLPLYAPMGGLVPEKLEGMALQGGKVWIINDNDGVDDNSGEMQLISFPYP